MPPIFTLIFHSKTLRFPSPHRSMPCFHVILYYILVFDVSGLSLFIFLRLFSYRNKNCKMQKKTRRIKKILTYYSIWTFVFYFYFFCCFYLSRYISEFLFASEFLSESVNIWENDSQTCKRSWNKILIPVTSQHLLSILFHVSIHHK